MNHIETLTLALAKARQSMSRETEHVTEHDQGLASFLDKPCTCILRAKIMQAHDEGFPQMNADDIQQEWQCTIWLLAENDADGMEEDGEEADGEDQEDDNDQEAEAQPAAAAADESAAGISKTPAAPVEENGRYEPTRSGLHRHGTTSRTNRTSWSCRSCV